MSDEPEMPPVPGVFALVGLLFFKPLTLGKLCNAWGFSNRPSALVLLSGLREQHVRRWFARLFVAVSLSAVPTAVFAVILLKLYQNANPADWEGALRVGIPIGTAIAMLAMLSGLALRFIVRLLAGVVTAAFIAALLLTMSPYFSELQSAHIILAAGVGFGRLVGVRLSLLIGLLMIAVSILFAPNIQEVERALMRLFVLSPDSGPVYALPLALALSVSVVVGGSRLVIYLFQAPICVLLRLLTVLSPRTTWGTQLLPTRWDQSIYLPLPFLRGLLIHHAEREPSLITEAIANIGQRAVAKRAQGYMRCRTLEALARTGRWVWPESPFLPASDEICAGDSLYVFVTAAARLDAATLSTRAQERRRQLLRSARSALESARATTVTSKPQKQLRLDLVRAWLAAIDRAEAALDAEAPEVPDVFQEGNRLNYDNPDHRPLFKGRHDLVAIIDRDLSAKQKAPLLLTGQRRVGKSSLLQMLPHLLSTIETVLIIDFQQVASEPDRGNPHRILARRLHVEFPNLPPPPDAETWGPTLTWMVEANTIFAADNCRVILAIDEIERLQDGIKAGWAPPDFLDFLRAAGDRLANIRLLLVSAHPIQRLGEIWCDRLISAIQRPIGPLEPDQARELLEAPIPDFPSIWPAGSVDRVCKLTGNHPFLLQAVGNKVVQALNTRGDMQATDDDVDRALDQAVNGPALFPDLWKDRRDDEKRLLRRLAGSDETDSLTPRRLDPNENTPAAWLRREGFIIDEDGGSRIATPLFATWIRVWGQADA